MKKVKILTITLIIGLITMISFCGVYVQYQNRMENKVKDYSYAMDLKGARNIRLKVNTENKTIIKDSEGNPVENTDNLTDEQIAEKGYTKEETPYNSEEVKNLENYKKSKEVIEKRLKNLKVENYITKLDEQTGDIIIDVPENDKTDSVISNINTVGKFEIVDSETNEVLMTNDDIKSSAVLYSSEPTTATTYGTLVYLNIKFTKDGAKKLEDISNKYVEVKDNNTENQTTENSSEETSGSDSETTEKKITLKIDDEEIMSTSFDEPLKTGELRLSIGSATTDTEKLQEYIDQASSMAAVLDSGKTPVTYEIEENKYILSDITDNELQVVIYAMLAIVVIALIVFIIKYKSLGALGVISYIGLVSVLMLIVRYTNVVLSIEGIFGIAIVFVLNYIFVNKLLSKVNKYGKELKVQDVKKANKETYKEFFIGIMPVMIMVVTFCFIKWIPISSFGMVMFWGISLIAIYNVIVTNSLLKVGADLKIGGKKK